MMKLEQCCPLLEVIFDEKSFSLMENLSKPNRLFAYYMYMAERPTHRIYLKQLCPYPETLDKIHRVLKEMDKEHQIYEELKRYWVYLYVNYGVHFARSNKENKYTPEMLGLNTITPQSLKGIGVELTEDEQRYLFDYHHLPTLTVKGNIEASGSAFFGTGMTTQLYQTMSSERQNMLNGYHYLDSDTGEVKTTTYSLQGICQEEIRQSLNWLEKALDVARDYPVDFDNHTVASLEHLITYLTTGNEVYFRYFSEEWLQMNNPHVEYNYGFIEYYEDPMGHIGSFETDITLKSLDIKALLNLLPSFEERFPFPSAWKRQNMSSIPNAATAHKIFATASLGPALTTIAYCLPNYTDIRSNVGSKQVMYTLPSKVKDPEKYQTIYLTDRETQIYEKFSPDYALKNDVFNLLVTLHETIGHASGNTFSNISEATGKWKNGLEEMRAEILALYTAITFHEEIVQSGILGDWPKLVDKDDLFYLYLMCIGGKGWTRWVGMQKDETEITQAHAQADTGIMYYLVDNSDDEIRLVEKLVQVDDKELKVLRLNIGNIDKAIQLVGELAETVQRFTSIGPREEIDTFMRKYAYSTRNSDYSGIVKEMDDCYKGGIKGSVYMFPEWDFNDGDPVPKIPSNSFDHYLHLFKAP